MSKRLRASMRAANKGRNLRPRASLPPEERVSSAPASDPRALETLREPAVQAAREDSIPPTSSTEPSQESPLHESTEPPVPATAEAFTDRPETTLRPDVLAAQAAAEEEARRDAEAEEEARAQREELERAEAELRAKREELERAEAAARARREAAEKAEAEAKAKREADEKARREAEAKAKAEADADAKAKREADAKTKAEADAKAKREAEAKAKAEADAKKAKAEADAKAKTAKADEQKKAAAKVEPAQAKKGAPAAAKVEDKKKPAAAPAKSFEDELDASSVSAEFFRQDKDSVPPVEEMDEGLPPQMVLSPSTLARRARLRRLVAGVVSFASVISIAVVGKTLAASKRGTPTSAPTALIAETKHEEPKTPPPPAKPEPKPAETAAAELAKVEEKKAEEPAKVDDKKAEEAKADDKKADDKKADDKKAEETKPAASAADAAALTKEAESLLNRGKRKESIEKAKEAIAADPTQAMPYLLMGSALQDSGKWKDGIEAYCECVRNATKGPVHECRAMGGHK